MVGILSTGQLSIGGAVVAVGAGTLLFIIPSKITAHSLAQRRNALSSRVTGMALCLTSLLLLLATYLLSGNPSAQTATVLLMVAGGTVMVIAALLALSIGLALGVLNHSE